MAHAHKRRDRPWPKAAIGPHRGSCASGKVCYETHREANRAVDQMPTAASRRAYRCETCAFWHLTSQREFERPPLRLRHVRPGPSLPPDLIAPS